MAFRNLRIFLALLLPTSLFAQKAVPRPASHDLDILIRNGSVLDGSGAAAKHIDIGIRGDRIVLLAKSTRLKAKRVIDARGLVVAPGFIDPHTHTLGDLSNPASSGNDAYLMQGVTTVAVGNDGSSPLQIGATLRKLAQQGVGTNVAMFIGQGSVRRAVMGMSDAVPTPAQMASMKALVDRGMKEGAIGMSTGLFYAPGSYSSTEEVIALAKVAAADGGIYDTHMRDEDSYSIGLLNAVRETIRIGREAHIPVMISHIKALGKNVWGQSTAVIALVNDVRASGVNVTASQYPYNASGTSIQASLIPRWAEVDGRTALLRRIDDPQIRPRLIADMQKNLDDRGGPETLLITVAPDKEFMGKTLAAIAQEHKISPIEAAFMIIKKGGASVASFNMQESDIRNFMRQPWVMTCSDGSPGHPRKYGTFPRKLRKYVFDEHVIPLPFAIRSMTSLPAETLRLKDRGLLKPGYFADVVIFDPTTIRALSTYKEPKLLATGVTYLLVNGQFAIDAGKLTNIRAGRALPHGYPYPATGPLNSSLPTPVQKKQIPSAMREHIAEVRQAQKAAYAISDASNGCPIVGSDMLGWPGNLVRHCIYTEGPANNRRTGVVYLLDVQPDVIAQWIETGCQQQMAGVSSCFATVLKCGKENSGLLFPISGNMMENMDSSPWKNYFFRNGMTVDIDNKPNATTDQIPIGRQEELAHLPNSAVTSIPSGLLRFWRTLPRQFAKRYPNEGVIPNVDSRAAQQKWLDVARAEFLTALKSPTNRLLAAWIAAHPETLRAGECPGDNSP